MTSAPAATGITAAAGRFPGTLSAALIHGEASRDFRLTRQSGSAQAQRRWLTSAERARRHDKGRGIAGARTAAQQRPELEARFCVPGHGAATIKPPPRWKGWLVSLVAVYPLVLLFQAFVAPRIKDWPLAAKSALLPLSVLTLLTYGVMPPVSRLLRGWLRSSSRARRRGRCRQHSSGTAAARVRPSRDGRGRTPARCWPGWPPAPSPTASPSSPPPSPGTVLICPVPLPRSSTWPWRAPATAGSRPGGPAPRSSRGQYSQPVSERYLRP